ncbi:MAG: hypothetical protein K8R39_05005 [Arcobacteraceae bacterium]|nr:hypothetical protein [Arcobacteraceae bacterium]
MLKEDKRFMRKEYVYTLFVLKFLLGIGLIYWTIATTMKSDVGQDADNAFLSTYQDVDRNYNNMMESNKIFGSKYNVKFLFNNQEVVGLSIEDVFLAQRSIQARKDRKDMVNVGENKFTILVQDKDGNDITNKTVKILVTKNTTHTEDVKLEYQNEDTKEFTINSIGYWNITGTIDIQGDKGFFYIKTNAKKES